MNGLKALGYMLLEEGLIVEIRNGKEKIPYSCAEDIISHGCYAYITTDKVLDDTFEIGWRCMKCEGSGEITVDCPMCKGHVSEMCDGKKEVKCPDCNGEGIRWEKEY